MSNALQIPVGDTFEFVNEVERFSSRCDFKPVLWIAGRRNMITNGIWLIYWLTESIALDFSKEQK